MWSCDAPMIWKARASRGGATQVAALSRFFFLTFSVLLPGDEELGFSEEEWFYGKDRRC